MPICLPTVRETLPRLTVSVLINNLTASPVECQNKNTPVDPIPSLCYTWPDSPELLHAEGQKEDT